MYKWILISTAIACFEALLLSPSVYKPPKTPYANVSQSLQQRTSNDDFLLNTLKTRFRQLQSTFSSLETHYILSVAIKFVSVRSSYWTLSIFEITRASVLFSRNFYMQFIVLRMWEFFWLLSQSHFLDPKILGFLFLRKTALRREWNVKNWASENRKEFMR